MLQTTGSEVLEAAAGAFRGHAPDPWPTWARSTGAPEPPVHKPGLRMDICTSLPSDALRRRRAPACAHTHAAHLPCTQGDAYGLTRFACHTARTNEGAGWNSRCH